MEKFKLNMTDSVADTLFLTLYAKAVETKKTSPLITDSTACELVDKVDYDFSKYKNKKASSVGVALRATHFDNMVKQFINKHENPVVILLACGLDARVQRIGSASQKAVFYELDIEEVIALRKELIPKAANEHYIASSMFATEWMDDILAKHPNGNFIIIIEGVLMYFYEEENKSFFVELAKRFKGAEVHFDMLNKWMSRHSKMHDTVSKSKATFRHGIDDVKEIEQWHPALKYQRTYLYKDFKGWRRMGFVFSTLMSIIPTIKNSSRPMAYLIEKN